MQALYANEDFLILVSVGRFTKSEVMNMLISLSRSGAAITQTER